jgi:hypothetical protein
MKCGGVTTEWRPLTEYDSRPNGEPDYYWMQEFTQLEQWADHWWWKRPSDGRWMDKTYSITFTMKGNAPYTHKLRIIE